MRASDILEEEKRLREVIKDQRLVIEKLEQDLYDVRLRSAKVLRSLKAYLGLETWPQFDGDFIEGVCGLLQHDVDIVYADDWEGLYINGKLVMEEHSLSTASIFEALGVEYDLFEADVEWLADRGNLPPKFEDVKVEGDG